LHMWLLSGTNQRLHPGCHMVCKHSSVAHTLL
jgi:hypothetical protein